MEEAMFEHLFQKYKDMIYRVAFLYLKNEADALDIVRSEERRVGKECRL